MRTYQFKTIPANEIPNNNRPIISTSVQSSTMSSSNSRMISPHIYNKKEQQSSNKRLITEPTYANNLSDRLIFDSVEHGRAETYEQNKLNGQYLNANSERRGNLINTQANSRSSTYRMSNYENEQPTYSNEGRIEYEAKESTKGLKHKTNMNSCLNESAGAHNIEKQHEMSSEAISLLESKIKALEEEKYQLSKSVTNAKAHSEQLETQSNNMKVAQEEQTNKLAKSIKHEEELSQNHKIEMQRLREEFESRVREMKEQRLNEEEILRSEAKEMEQKIANLSVQSNQQSNEESFEVRRLINDLAIKEVQIQQLEGQLGSKNENISVLIKNLEQAKGEAKQLKGLKEQMQKEKYEQFDEILMTQMQSIKELEEKMEGLNENCNELKEEIIESERKNESLTNEITIMELRHKSEIKNIELQSQIESNTKHNAIDNLQKKMMVMEEKYKMAVTEIKTKDEFFRQHLLGRTDQSDTKAYIVSILEKYQSTFRKDENS